jgi:hypothetical protein
MRRELTWDANNSSSCCGVCQKPFGRLLQRKHHCRHCGRLVCQQCSQHRLTLPTTTTTATALGDQHNEPAANEPVRVCDPCKRVIVAKEEKQMQQLQQIDRKIELLRATSLVSSCLLDVYFLDGGFKTICYDDSTTIGELSLSLVATIKVALFEVEQDLFNPTQFQLLFDDLSIASIVHRWKERQWKYAKLVLPIQDSRGVVSTKISAFTSASNSSVSLSSSLSSSVTATVPIPRSSSKTNMKAVSSSLPDDTVSIGEDLGTTTGTTLTTYTAHGNSVDEVVLMQVGSQSLPIISVSNECSRTLNYDCVVPLWSFLCFPARN